MKAINADTPIAPNLSEQIAELLAQGGTLGSALEYSETDYEALYAFGHSLYSQSRYQDAVRIFGFLVMHNHLEPRYMNAYASSLQMCGNYLEALKLYSMASLMDIEDPLPTLHTAECMLALDMVKEVREALVHVLRQSDAPQHAELRARALAMQALLNQPAATSPAAHREPAA